MKFNVLILLLSIFASCSTSKKWITSSSKMEDNLHDVEAIDNNKAFAYSYGTGKFFTTSDGGNSWEKIHQFDSLYFEQVQFVNDKIGWLIGSPSKIYKTIDGGRNWQKQTLKKESPHALLYGAYFKDVNTGYVAAINRTPSGLISNIYQTTDGGINWNLINSINEMILNIEFIDNTIYGTGQNVIIKDIHDKKKWSYSFKDSTNVIGGIRDIAMNPNEKMIAVSFNGFVLEWLNNDWKTTQITKNRIRSLAYHKKYWIAAGDTDKENGNLFFSYDNGKIWVKSKEKFPDIHRIHQSKNKIWMVGKGGFVMTKIK